MSLNRKVKFTDPLLMKDTFEKAKISKSDLQNPIFEKDMIFDFMGSGGVTLLEESKEIKKYPIPLHYPQVTNRPILAYDESIQKFNMLQGTLVFTAHALIEAEKEDYDYSCIITTYFTTKASNYSTIKIAIISDNPEEELKLRYLSDRYDFLLSDVPNDSILFIDGPLIGSQSSSKNIRLVKDLMEKNIIPIFYVKNSYSSMIIDHMGGEYKQKYNTDLDFANKLLKVGERTSYFDYKDPINSDNHKVFAYVKCYERIPQRFEMYYETYRKHENLLDSIISMINFYSVLQGDSTNPQLRLVAIAERFARESLKYFSPSQLILTTGLDETMNAARGFG